MTEVTEVTLYANFVIFASWIMIACTGILEEIICIVISVMQMGQIYIIGNISV